MTSRINTRSVYDVYAEGLRYFMGQGDLHGALGKLCSDLERRGIDYMIIGAVALMAHGYPRFDGPRLPALHGRHRSRDDGGRA
ncbi:MAG: hypothetical protein LC800_08975 [Acidobacteria bacterium]|nr:hypothetical protein [Acidobacteriota bacterium]